MYLEDKDGGVVGDGRIGRVTFSKSGKTLRYKGMEFQTLKGLGFKANYFEVNTGSWFWISGCRKDGNDVLYAGVIEIDEDVQEEYWRDIRKRPENIGKLSFRAPGKHSVRTDFEARDKRTGR